MGYLTGLFKYIVKSAVKNTYPMVVFGAAILALLYLLNDLARGQLMSGIIAYITTKYLPPLTAEAFLIVLTVGCVWAGIKWFLNTPRR
jgi:hypothetical protein